VHAALTGHLVLSTLHTSGAAQAPVRLSDMGIPSYLLAASLSLVISQRLARRVCPHCGKEEILSAEEAASLSLPARLAGLPVRKGEGCPHCRKTGASGRQGIFEMLEIGREERLLLHRGALSDELEARFGAQKQLTLSEAAERLLRDGVIPPAEAAGLIE